MHPEGQDRLCCPARSLFCRREKIPSTSADPQLGSSKRLVISRNQVPKSDLVHWRRGQSFAIREECKTMHCLPWLAYWKEAFAGCDLPELAFPARSDGCSEFPVEGKDDRG